MLYILLQIIWHRITKDQTKNASGMDWTIRPKRKHGYWTAKSDVVLNNSASTPSQYEL